MYASLPGLERPIRPASPWRLRAMARQLLSWTDEERGTTPERYEAWHELITSATHRLRRDDKATLNAILSEAVPCA